MKLLYGVLLVTFLGIVGCEPYVDPCEIPVSFEGLDEAKLQSDLDSIDVFLAANNITADMHPSGLRYIIKKEGTGGVPTLCDFVLVGYKGYFMDSSVFSQTPTNDVSRFLLENLVKGWQVGLPLIKTGGEITLIIPSPLGYSDYITYGVPQNSILLYDIKFYAIQ